MEEGFAPVVKAIKKWDKEVRTELRKELRASGEMIASGSRLLASAHSKEIASTIKVRTGIQSRQATVEIRAGSQEVPEAGLFELGNKKSKPGARTFRHPVFARKGSHGAKDAQWVNQEMHPFLAPIIKLRQAAVTKRVEAAVQRATETVRL